MLTLAEVVDRGQWGQFSHCNNPESGVGSNPWQAPFALSFLAPSIM